LKICILGGMLIFGYQKPLNKACRDFSAIHFHCRRNSKTLPLSAADWSVPGKPQGSGGWQLKPHWCVVLMVLSIQRKV